MCQLEFLYKSIHGIGPDFSELAFWKKTPPSKAIQAILKEKKSLNRFAPRCRNGQVSKLNLGASFSQTLEFISKFKKDTIENQEIPCFAIVDSGIATFGVFYSVVFPRYPIIDENILEGIAKSILDFVDPLQGKKIMTRVMNEYYSHHILRVIYSALCEFEPCQFTEIPDTLLNLYFGSLLDSQFWIIDDALTINSVLVGSKWGPDFQLLRVS